MGYRTFALEMNIPFYMLRRGIMSAKDVRQKPDGKTLRQAWDLPSLALLRQSASSHQKETDYIGRFYDAQISFAVTGFDHWTWTAYAFIDTNVDYKETVDGYHGIYQETGGLFRPDPASAGLFDANKHCWAPREYFLKVFETRIKQVLKEWYGVVDWLQEAFNQYV